LRKFQNSSPVKEMGFGNETTFRLRATRPSPELQVSINVEGDNDIALEDPISTPNQHAKAHLASNSQDGNTKNASPGIK